MELRVFEKTIDKLVDVGFTKLLLLKQMNKMIILGPIAALKNEITKLDVILTSRAINTGVIDYKLVDCDKLKNK